MAKIRFQQSALLIALCCISLSNCAETDSEASADAKVSRNHLGYIPSNAVTSAACVLYLLAAASMFYNTWKWGAKYMLCMPIGAVFMAAGFAARMVFARNTDSLGLYIGQHTLIVLSPCAFIAGIYIILGRLVAHLGMDQYLMVRPTRVTKIFLSSDIITFLIQAGGGGLVTSSNASSRDMGEKIFLAGLILQLMSLGFFTIVFGVFLYRFHQHRPDIWYHQSVTGTPWYSDWRALAVSMAISCLGALIRSFYRVVELAQGFDGHLATTESYFYILDACPLLIAIGVYVPFWPGRLLNASTKPQKFEGTAQTVSDVEARPLRYQAVEMNDVLARAR